MAFINFVPRCMSNEIREKLGNPPALRLEYDPDEFEGWKELEIVSELLNDLKIELVPEVERFKRERTRPNRGMTTTAFLFGLLVEKNIIWADNETIEQLQLAISYQFDSFPSDFVDCDLEQQSPEMVNYWIWAAICRYIELQKMGFGWGINNRNLSELYWTLVAFFEVARAIDLIEKNPCRQELAMYLYQFGRCKIWHNPNDLVLIECGKEKVRNFYKKLRERQYDF